MNRTLAKSDSRVVRIDATEAALAVMGPNFMDNRRRLTTLEHAVHSIRVSVENAPTA
jgi:NTE family protein